MKQDHKLTLRNPFRSLRHSPSEVFTRLRLRSHTTSRRHSNSNPRVLPCGSNSLHPVADRDESRRSRKRVSAFNPLLGQNSVTILQPIKQLGVTMDNSLEYQSQLPRFNPDGYRDQQTLHCLYLVQIRLLLQEKEVTSLILRAHITPHW